MTYANARSVSVLSSPLWSLSARKSVPSRCDHIPQPNPQPQQRRRASESANLTRIHGIHGRVSGLETFAAAATETSHNLISDHFARECGLSIEHRGQSLKIKDNTAVSSAGKAVGEWHFAGETVSARKVTFEVIPELNRHVILGNDFLQETQSLNINRHRIKSQASHYDGTRSVHFLGAAQHSVIGKFDQKPVCALPGSGCEANIISESLMLSHGLGQALNKNICKRLKLVNGTMALSIGQIQASWRFGCEFFPWPGRDQEVIFDVLPNSPYDVILGQEFLFENNAYLQYPHCFLAQPPGPVRATVRAGIAVAPFYLRILSAQSVKSTAMASKGVTGATATFKASSLKGAAVTTKVVKGASATAKGLKGVALTAKGLKTAAVASTALGTGGVVFELERRAAADRLIERLPQMEQWDAFNLEQDRRANWCSLDPADSEAAIGASPNPKALESCSRDIVVAVSSTTASVQEDSKSQSV